MIMNKKSMMAILCGLVFVAMLATPAVFAEEQKTIQGTISEDGTIITQDGDEYYIDESDEKDALMEKVEEDVTVIGTITEEDGQKTIKIKSYKIVE